MNIPDYFEPLIGWRCWSVINHTTGAMKALTNDYYWQPGKAMQAKCSHCGGPTKPKIHTNGNWLYNQNHDGFYSFKTIHDLVADRAFGVVVGQIYLWGTVAEHHRGYRSEFAYPKALICSSKRERDLLEEKWKVEVVVGNIEKIFRDAKEALLRKIAKEHGETNPDVIF